MKRKTILTILLFLALFSPSIIMASDIYLTFEDGPCKNTAYILNILKNENIKATFFITGKGSDYLIKKEYDEGHSIGLHTYSHNYKYIYSSTTNFFNDLNILNDRLFSITQTKSNIIRFPGGSSNTISKRYKRKIMSELVYLINGNYKYYDWNIDSKDTSGISNCNKVYKNVVENLRKDRINMVLMHDSKTCTRKVLRKIIIYGKKKGYHFKKITNKTKMIIQKINN